MRKLWLEDVGLGQIEVVYDNGDGDEKWRRIYRDVETAEFMAIECGMIASGLQSTLLISGADLRGGPVAFEALDSFPEQLLEGMGFERF
jgi:hypothetical protein